MHRRPLAPLCRREGIVDSFTTQPSPGPLASNVITQWVYSIVIDMAVVEGWWVILTLFSGMNCCPDCLSRRFDSAQLCCQSVHDPLPWVLILDPPIQSGSRSAGHCCCTLSGRAAQTRSQRDPRQGRCPPTSPLRNLSWSMEGTRTNFRCHRSFQQLQMTPKMRRLT